MLTSGVFVIVMNAAFALLEAGSVQSRNVLNIMLKNIADMTLGWLAWWAFGFRIAFGQANDGWPVKMRDESFWFFHWTFASTAATIDSGAVAERMNFFAYCFISFITTGIIYPVVVRFIWANDGWLHKEGFRDFAGSSVIHLLGGTSAITLCTLLGPRIGRFTDYKPFRRIPASLQEKVCQRSSEPDYYLLPPGSPPLQRVSNPISMIMGVFLLWIGWYGFTPGAVQNIETGGTYVVGHIMVNTTLGALGGGVAAFFFQAIFNGARISADGLAVGILSGLVSVTAGCAYIGNGVSFLLGFCGSLVAFKVKALLEYWRIDDVVNAVPIHGACGLFGTVMIGFFAEPWSCTTGGPVGVLFAHTPEETKAAWKLVRIQFLGCAMVIAWTALVTFSIAFLLNQTKFFRLRLPRAQELIGLDEAEHGMSHNNVDFENTIKEMLECIVEGGGKPKEIVEACGRAVRCLTHPHAMKEARSSRVEHSSNMTLTVTIHKAEGLAILPETGAHVEVEIACARPLQPGQEVTEEDLFFTFFAPRRTKVAYPDGSITWNQLVAFKQFYLPTGTEDTIYAMCTIIEDQIPVGQARLPLASVKWQEHDGDGSLSCDAVVPLYPVKHHKHTPEGATLSVHLEVRPTGEASQHARSNSWSAESHHSARALFSKGGSIAKSCILSMTSPHPTESPPMSKDVCEHKVFNPHEINTAKELLAHHKAVEDAAVKCQGAGKKHHKPLPPRNDEEDEWTGPPHALSQPAICTLEGRIRAVEADLANPLGVHSHDQLDAAWALDARLRSIERRLSGKDCTSEDILRAPPNTDEWTHILEQKSVRNYILETRMAALAERRRRDQSGKSNRSSSPNSLNLQGSTAAPGCGEKTAAQQSKGKSQPPQRNSGNAEHPEFSALDFRCEH